MNSYQARAITDRVHYGLGITTDKRIRDVFEDILVQVEWLFQEEQVVSVDERLKPFIEKWKEQTENQIKCLNEEDDQTLCPNCDNQLFSCDCSLLTAQKILELQFGFDDFTD